MFPSKWLNTFFTRLHSSRLPNVSNARAGKSVQDWGYRNSRGQREKTLGATAGKKLKCKPEKCKLNKRVIKLKPRGLGAGRDGKEWSGVVTAL